MKIIKEKTVAFTGNRELNTPDGRPDHNLINVIRTELYYALEDCYHEGKNTFLDGMAWGFDLLAAEVTLELKTKYPDIKLIAVIPFMGQELTFSQANQKLFKKINDAADERIFIRDGYSNEAYHKRNDFLIDNCSEMIAYCNTNVKGVRGKGHGTLSTIRKAEQKGLFVTNIFDELSDYFQNNSPAKKYLQRYSHIESFKFGRNGLLFDGAQSRIEVPYDNICDISDEGLFLKISLNNGLTYNASIYGGECFISGL